MCVCDTQPPRLCVCVTLNPRVYGTQTPHVPCSKTRVPCSHVAFVRGGHKWTEEMFAGGGGGGGGAGGVVPGIEGRLRVEV